MTYRCLGRVGLAVFAVVALATMVSPASAELLLNVTNVTVNPGETGFVEVYFTSPDGIEDRINAYNLGLDILKDGNVQSDVQFTSYSYTTLHTPIFGSQTPAGTANSVLPSYFGAAVDNSASGADVLITNNMGLLKLNFTASASAGGTYQLAFRTDSLYTNFSRNDGLLLGTNHDGEISTYGFVNGTLTVTPEPSTLVLLAIGLVGMVYAWRKRK